MKKKVLPLVLAIALCLGLSVPVAAASDTMSIGSAADLLAFGERLKTDPGLNGMLTADINLAGVTWETPLASVAPYTGTLDGNGHTISGLTGSHGFLKELGPEGIIRNLNLMDINLSGTGGYMGGLADVSKGLIENCTVTGNIHTTNRLHADLFVGGLVGCAAAGGKSYVVGCRTDVNITADYAEDVPLYLHGYGIGGLAGSATAGYNNSLTIIDRCQCDGDITVNAPQPSCFGDVGGVVGISSGTIKNCGNTGVLTLNTYPSRGGNCRIGEILGNADARPFEGAFVENCWGTGDIHINAPELADRIYLNLFGSNGWIDCTVTGAYYAPQSRVGGPDLYLPADTTLAYGRGTPLFTRAELTNGSLVTKLNEYVAAHPEEGLMAWTQGPNGPKLTNSSVVPAKPAFSDVPAGAWYSDAVDWAVKKNITTGTGNGKFSPTQNCTHVQILTFLYRAARGGGTASPADMDAAVSWAREKGMIGASFNGAKECTRVEAVNYIWQALDKPAAAASSFTDMAGYENYAKAVDWAVASGVTQGTNTAGTMFSPDTVCTRGHIVTFLYRGLAE